MTVLTSDDMVRSRKPAPRCLCEGSGAQSLGTVGPAEAGITGFTATAGVGDAGLRGGSICVELSPAPLVATLVAATMLLLFGAVAGFGSVGGSASAAQYQYGKVTICHVAGESGERVTIDGRRRGGARAPRPRRQARRRARRRGRIATRYTHVGTKGRLHLRGALRSTFSRSLHPNKKAKSREPEGFLRTLGSPRQRVRLSMIGVLDKGRRRRRPPYGPPAAPRG